MRKILFLVLVLSLGLLAAFPALGETYTMGDIRASVEIPDDYETVLTPYNLSTQTDYIASLGLDFDTLSNAFETDGILLQAMDAENSRTLVITAVKDVDAQTYFDLNNQDEDMRKEFRVSHTNGAGYSILGYSYTSAQWANYGKNALRFLKTQYTLRQDGQLVCSGYQRRTIRNGFTITLDMQVRGRNAKEADNTALEKIMKTFSFTEILPMPELPIKLAVTSAPPAEVNEESFTIKGTTLRKAKVTATLFSLGAANGSTFSTTANNSGSFSLKVTLPSEGIYSLTLTSESEGAKTAQRLYSVQYKKGILPVEITTAPSEVLSDQTIVSGSTVSGAKVQLAISGPITYTKTVSGPSFQFKVDTSAEGTYQFVLAITKKGLTERSFTYTSTRAYSDTERDEKVRSTAKKMTYANLPKNENKGKTVVETGYITGIEKNIDEWVVTFALTKTNNGTYKEIVYLICREEPAFAVGAKVKVYGQAAGTFSELTEDGAVKSYPRITVSIIDPAE